MTVDPLEAPDNPLEPDKPPAPDADPPDENPDAEPEPEVEPIEPPSEPPAEAPAPTGLSPKEREAQQKKLDAEAKRHTERITALLGDEAEDVTECPFCDPQLQGYFYDSQLATPRSEMQAAMIDALKRPLQVEYVQAENISQCNHCKGLGKVLTGSLVPRNESVACRGCNGFGYLPPPTMAQNGGISTDQLEQLVAVGGPELVYEDVDNWNHPRLLPDGRENPNYGRQPQYIDPNYP